MTDITYNIAHEVAGKVALVTGGGIRVGRALALGLNVVDGKVTYPGVAEAFHLPLADVGSVL